MPWSSSSVSFIPVTGNRWVTAVCSPQLSLLPGLKLEIYSQWQSFGQGSDQINRIKEVAWNRLKALQRTTLEPVVKVKRVSNQFQQSDQEGFPWNFGCTILVGVFLSANSISYTYLTIPELLIAPYWTEEASSRTHLSLSRIWASGEKNTKSFMLLASTCRRGAGTQAQAGPKPSIFSISIAPLNFIMGFGSWFTQRRARQEVAVFKQDLRSLSPPSAVPKTLLFCSKNTSHNKTNQIGFTVEKFAQMTLCCSK